MEPLTVRGIDRGLMQALRALAESEGISVDRAALQLLRKGAGLAGDRRRPNCIGDSLDHLIGAWTDAEAAAFRARVRERR